MTEKNLGSVNSGDEKIKVNVDGAWSTLKGRLENEGLVPEYAEPDRRFLTPALRVAASIAVLVALSLSAWFIFSPDNNPAGFAYETNNSEAFGLALPDGSIADLNADSKIQYRTDEAGNRLVRLTGEVFFNVAADPEKPFIIETGKAVVRVTGTSFSVRSDTKNRRIEVFVESGNVQLYQSGDMGNIIELGSGKLGILENNALSMEENTDQNYLSWKTRKLTFRQASLGEVARVLNRTYKKEIHFGNDVLEECLFTGTFDMQPVDSVVRVIQLAFNLDVEQNKNSYVLSGEGCK